MVQSAEPHPIFAMLSDKEEDRFTELLAHLLRNAFVLRQFLSELCRIETVNGDLLVRTQVLVDSGRPDLCVSGPGVQILFEAKVGSWLHQDQVRPYAEYLAAWSREHPEGIARLFLIVPAPDAKAEASLAKEQSGGLIADPQVIAWEEIGALFKVIAPRAPTRIGVYLEDFEALVSKRLGDSLRPFTAEEVEMSRDHLVGRFLALCSRYVTEVAEVLGDRYELSTAGGKTDLYMGVNLQANGEAHGTYWFGIWPGPWGKFGKSPLFLQDFVRTPHDLRNLPDLQSFEVVESAGVERALVPLVLSTGLDPTDQVESIVAQIERWVRSTSTEVV